MVGYHPASGYVQGINDLVTPEFFVTTPPVFLTEYEYIIDGRLPPRQWLRTGYQRPSHTLLCSLPHRVHHRW